MTKVVSIQYPCGGFGHFTHVILSSFCKVFEGDFINYNFGQGGDSHAYPLKLPKYYNGIRYDQEKFLENLSNLKSEYATVLIDSGVDDSDQYRKFISSDISVRVYYDDWSWPMIAKMVYTRCMAALEGKPQSINDWINPDQNNWEDSSQPWAIREKFFLYLRDHSHRYNWRSNSSTLNIPIASFLTYNTLHKSLSACFELSNFEPFYNSWYETNYEHFKSYLDAQDIIKNLHNNRNINSVDDYYTQSVVYYFIWLKYQFEIPHNDYNWFTNTSDIVKMLREHGVEV